jgi:hypothetical protein
MKLERKRKGKKSEERMQMEGSMEAGAEGGRWDGGRVHGDV